MTRALTVPSLFVLAALCAHAAANDAVREAVAPMLPAGATMSISASPVPGVSEVAIGVEVFYVSNDGQYLLGGPLITTAGQVNLTEQRVAQARRRIIAEASVLRLYRYPAREPRHRITVVTDIDCPYCRRLHNDMQAYNEAGIDVSYIMLPRAGKGSKSYIKTVDAACAADPEGAITAAMNGEEVASSRCEHPIDEHLEIVRRLKLGSTPSIVLENGSLVVGYKDPQALLALIEGAD